MNEDVIKFTVGFLFGWLAHEIFYMDYATQTKQLNFIAHVVDETRTRIILALRSPSPSPSTVPVAPVPAAATSNTPTAVEKTQLDKLSYISAQIRELRKYLTMASGAESSDSDSSASP